VYRGRCGSLFVLCCAYMTCKRLLRVVSYERVWMVVMNSPSNTQINPGPLVPRREGSFHILRAGGHGTDEVENHEMVQPHARVRVGLGPFVIGITEVGAVVCDEAVLTGRGDGEIKRLHPHRLSVVHGRDREPAVVDSPSLGYESRTKP